MLAKAFEGAGGCIAYVYALKNQFGFLHPRENALASTGPRPKKKRKTVIHLFIADFDCGALIFIDDSGQVKQWSIY